MRPLTLSIQGHTLESQVISEVGEAHFDEFGLVGCCQEAKNLEMLSVALVVES